MVSRKLQLRPLRDGSSLTENEEPKILFIIFVLINILVTPHFTRAEGFDSVIQLPRAGLRRTQTRSRWVLSVDDYGAKGDGLSNDTEAFLEAWNVACSISGFIRDDCISIVRNCSRVWIRNISCGPGHGISIGSLGKSKKWEKVQNVIVDGAYLYNTDNGVRVKTWQGGSGFASKITFQNILMENVSNPIIIDQYYCDSHHPCENQSSAVRVENISFIDIQGTSATKEAVNLLAVIPLRVKDYIWRIFLLHHALEEIPTLSVGKLVVLLGVSCILLPVSQAVMMVLLDRMSG